MAKEHVLLINLPAPYFNAIGKVTAKWSVLEMRLLAIIWHYMGIDMKKGRVLTFGLTSSAKIVLLSTLTLRWIADARSKAEVENFVETAERLVKRRNNFVHGIWGYHPDDATKKIKLFFFRTGQQKILADKHHYTPKEHPQPRPRD